MCWVCPLISFIGGGIGSYFGVKPPPTNKGKIISGFITTTLVTITTIALKIIFNISLCEGGLFTAKNILIVGAKTILIGVVYSIGVNYLLNRYVYALKEKSQPIQQEANAKKPPCCCK